MSMPPFSDTNPQPKIMFQLHKRPRMLKDFLQDDTNSCSLSRRPHSGDNNLNLVKFKPQSRSRSAFQAMVNALVKNIIKSPSIFPRSLSKKQSSRGDSNYKTGHDGEITVRVKDIIRWKSFRDLVEEKSPAFASPLRCTTATTTTSSGCCSSEEWSWCDSDFSCDEEECKKDVPRVGRDYLETTTETDGYNWVEPEEDVGSDEEEAQHSPVSVLDLQLRDDEEEALEKESSEWGLFGHNKEVCVREMEKGGRWGKFEEEQQEVCMEIELGLFGSMIDELLGDL